MAEEHPQSMPVWTEQNSGAALEAPAQRSGVVKRVFQRSVQALKTWPTFSEWQSVFVVLAAFGVAAVLVGWATGFLTWTQTELPPGTFLFTAAVLLVAPGLLEELIFRVWLLPHRTEPRSVHDQYAAVVFSVVVFAAWHVVNAWFFFPVAREVFWDWRFLVIVMLLGTACASVYLRTGSIYPAIFVHWAIVVAWKGVLGGPVFFE